MEKLQLLFDGNEKQVFATDEKDRVIFRYKDVATAYGGIKRATFRRKGILTCGISTRIFQYLNDHGIQTHFVEPFSEREQVCRPIGIIPINVSVRNYAAGTMARRLGLPVGEKLSRPVYATPTLHAALAHHTFAAPYITGCRRDLEEGAWNEIGPFLVHAFTVPHDATQTSGFAILHEGYKFVIMTDIGRMTDEAVALASQADAVVVESNYDMDMLMGGPYTHELKMRICRGNGHLSNDECASAIRRFWHPGLKHLFLCHLSENNNTHELAYTCSKKALDDLGVAPGTVHLVALPRQYPSPLFTLRSE